MSPMALVGPFAQENCHLWREVRRLLEISVDIFQWSRTGTKNIQHGSCARASHASRNKDNFVSDWSQHSGLRPPVQKKYNFEIMRSLVAEASCFGETSCFSYMFFLGGLRVGARMAVLGR